MASSSSPAITCAENIAILSLPHKVVERQKTDSVPVVGVEQETRRLSLKQESDLSRTLAFLAGITDDPHHIAALCIEEDEAFGGLQIVVAINRTRPDDGSEVLTTTRSGFWDILLVLERVSKGVEALSRRRWQIYKVRSKTMLWQDSIGYTNFVASETALFNWP